MNKPLLSLVLIALTCGLLLSATHALTRAQTTANRQAFELEKLREVAGNVGWHIELMGSDAQGDEYYRLSDNNGPTGYVYRAETTAGYNGLIQLIMAVDLQGRVL
ncbi:MAG: hypothetical protein KDI36_20265, partial [Pseudomonadales bacterium]|nr:hypothetical protein [Pseudomonadales bacterium]